MRRILGVLAAAAAVLVFAPAALAVPTTYVVNSSGDGGDISTADLICDSDPTGGVTCTLRAAIQQANFNPGADTITFTGAGRTPAPATALPTVTDQVLIDGGGATIVTFAPSAAGPLLTIGAASSTVRAIALTGGGSGPLLLVTAGGVRLDSVTVRNAPGEGIRVSGPDARLDSPTVTSVGQTGIVLAGPRATVSAPEVAANGGNGIDVSGDTANITGGRVHGNSSSGVFVMGQGDLISRVKFFSNSGKPITLAGGANGGIAPPQNLRIGPRRADGSLPLIGSSSGGTIELWQGDPAGTAEPGLLDAFGVPAGDFSYSFASEPAPGQVFGLNLLGGLGSSEFATVAVPADVASPDVATARALSTTDVRVQPTERLDPASVQKEDFSLFMAGQNRTVDAVTVAPDGSFVQLTSSGWKAGEAGYVQLTGPGALSDSSGNASMNPTRLRVAAAPGDFIAPLAGSLKLTPKGMCLTRGRGCKTTGTTIRFITTEAGKATLVVQRGNRQVGKRLYSGITAGPNRLKFNGRLGGRKLRAGRYRVLLYVQDAVGNVTDQPPITLLNVRRVTR